MVALYLFRLLISYTCSSFANILPSNWSDNLVFASVSVTLSKFSHLKYLASMMIVACDYSLAL